MKKILKNKWIVIVFLSLLFLFTILVSLHFFESKDKRKETIVDPIVLPSNDDLEFLNTSSLSEEEIKLMIQSKKEELRTLFYESFIYQLKEIDAKKTDEENEKYVVLDEQFLRKLETLVVETIYYDIFNKMTLLKNDVNHTYYMMEKNAFDSIYLDSAIAEIEIESSSFRLISATDEKINASVTIYLEGNEDSCVNYPFELVKLNGEWKVNVFQNS